MSLNCGHHGPSVHPPEIREYRQQQRNDTDRGKVKNFEKNLSQFHFVHHK
jgi:hypothetical protein